MGFLEDSGLESLDKMIGCKLKHSGKILNSTLQNATRVTRLASESRKMSIQSMKLMPPSLKSEWSQRFKRVEELENGLTTFLNPESEDLKNLQKDALGQLSFQDEIFKCLNFMPFILLSISLFKIWAVPAMAICLPLLAWIIPYIFLKFMYKLPISPEQYTDIMKMMWTGNLVSFGKPAQPASLLSARSIIQSIFMVFSFVQSLVQPIQNAMHLYKTDATIYENGKNAIELVNIYEEFIMDCDNNDIFIHFRCPLSDLTRDDPRRAIHILFEEPERFRQLMRDFADLEILWKFSQTPHLKPAIVLERGNAPLFEAEGIFDLSLGLKAVSSSVTFTGLTPHAALTGPNGGGKSSFLRAILQCVILSQTYGIAPAERIVIRRFGWISSGLRLQDAPGDLSMFETEVWFAANLLRKENGDAPGLVLYDELFHSTNPPDGIKTAERFLNKIWKKEGIMSIISTHLYHLVEAAPESVQKLTCMADISPTGEIIYKYNVQKGVCKISSVKSIWKRFQL